MLQAVTKKSSEIEDSDTKEYNIDPIEEYTETSSDTVHETPIEPEEGNTIINKSSGKSKSSG